jgi:hypothetical protein
MSAATPYRSFHLRADIRGLIKRGDRALEGLLQDESGREMSPREARHHLLKMLGDGHVYIKCGACDNWSPEQGCLGHEVVK